MSWILIVALRSAETPDTTLSFNRVAMVGTAAISIVGLVGAIAFGIWLAILRDAFHVVGRLGDRGDRSLGIATVGDHALRSPNTGNPLEQGESARRFRSDRPECRADRVEPHIDRALAARPRVGSDRADRHRHDLEARCLSCSPLSDPTIRTSRCLLHIVGATVVFGALLASATSLALARGETRLLRLGYFSLLLVGLPGLILMRLSRRMDLPEAKLGRPSGPDQGARLAQHRILRRRLGRDPFPRWRSSSAVSASTGCATARGRRLCSRRRWSSRSSSPSPTPSPSGR